MKRFIIKYNTDFAFFKSDKFFFDKKAGLLIEKVNAQGKNYLVR